MPHNIAIIFESDVALLHDMFNIIIVIYVIIHPRLMMLQIFSFKDSLEYITVSHCTEMQIWELNLCYTDSFPEVKSVGAETYLYS